MKKNHYGLLSFGALLPEEVECPLISKRGKTESHTDRFGFLCREDDKNEVYEKK